MSFLQVAMRRDIQRRSVKTALVVGTILAVINYADVLLAGEMQASHWVKLCLTYLVPYCVATWAAVQAVTQEPSAIN